MIASLKDLMSEFHEEYFQRYWKVDTTKKAISTFFLKKLK